jgi:hypothetical protein
MGAGVGAPCTRDGRLTHVDPELQQFRRESAARPSGFACAIVRISARTSGGTVGRCGAGSSKPTTIESPVGARQ